jgi:hypothetical protein
LCVMPAVIKKGSVWRLRAHHTSSCFDSMHAFQWNHMLMLLLLLLLQVSPLGPHQAASQPCLQCCHHTSGLCAGHDTL